MKKTMKLTYVFVLTLVLTTFSCKNDDNEVVINAQNLEVTIDENPTNGQVVGTVETDGTGTLSYSITSQTPAGALAINTTTGVVTVADAALFDFETNQVITAIVAVAGALDPATVTINLNDLNEISAQDLTVAIDENPTNGQVVGTIQTGGSATSNFSITSQTPAGALNIDASTGVVTVADAALFDFETNPVITAIVAVTGALDPATVTINLNDLNEISAQDLTVTLDENPTNGQVVGTMEINGGGTLSYSITSQTPAGTLAINSSTGELTVADAVLFDFETNPVITATISIDNTVNTVTATVTINLNDLDEISAQDLTEAIDENPTTGQAVGTIQVTGGGTLSFSITSQSPAGAFNINASSGELTVADPNLFDFETNPIITANISVDNSVSTATAIATINLNDVDEISVQALTIEMDENPTNGQVLGTLQATSSEILSYTITFQNPAGAFNINSSTGELTVADASLFDFETNPNMLATISVSNSVYSVSANAYIDLNDLNESASVGDFRDGGVVFWVDPTDDNHGLVVALNNHQTSGTFWGCSGTITGATGTAIGTGETNTAAIVAAGCATPGSAIEQVSNLNINGYDDWFLPSVDEWNEINTNFTTIIWPAIQANGGTSFSGSNWSSTEDSSTNAFYFILSNTSVTIDKSLAIFGARAIRAF